MGLAPGLGDVVAADGDRVVVPYLLLDEVLLDVPHHLQGEFGGEDAGILPLILLEDIGLHRAAHRLQGAGPDLVVFLRRRLPSLSFPEEIHLLSMAALKKMASIMGAGPLMVMETLVEGRRDRSRRRASCMSSTVQMETPLSPTLP